MNPCLNFPIIKIGQTLITNIFVLFHKSYQIPVDVVVSWRADENSSLHKSHEAPEGLRFVFYLAQNGSQ